MGHTIPPGTPARPAGVRRGADEVERLLRESAFDLRTADAAGFRAWLEAELPRWRRDPIFVDQEAARELRRAHPALAALEAEWRHAAADDEASPNHARLEALDRELAGASRGVSWLTRAAAEAPGVEARAAKLHDFQRRERDLREQIACLLAESPERRDALRLRAELSMLLERTGVAAAEARLAELLTERGRRSARVGRDFEDEALETTLPHVATDLGEEPAALRILRGVKLGAAGLELDQLVVRRGDPGGRVDVVALVEVKSSPNDIGAGFRKRQRNLAWLTGDRHAYDPAENRTRRFPDGHFDRPAPHGQADGQFTLDPASFALFLRHPKTGSFMERLYFVTRWGTLAGASTAALSRMRHRVATDPRFDLDDHEYLAGLLRWCRALPDAIESPDVLRAYASAGLAPRILFLPQPRTDDPTAAVGQV